MLVPDTVPARLSDDAALELLEHADLLELGAAADAVRRRLHPCGRGHLHRRSQHQLHRLLHLGLPFLRLLQGAGQRPGLPAHPRRDLSQDRGDAGPGGTAIMMQGGLSPISTPAGSNTSSPTSRRATRYTCIASPPEVAHIAARAASPRPRRCGVCRPRDSFLPGGGAEVLVDRVRGEISPHKIPTSTWLASCAKPMRSA